MKKIATGTKRLPDNKKVLTVREVRVYTYLGAKGFGDAYFEADRVGSHGPANEDTVAAIHQGGRRIEDRLAALHQRSRRPADFVARIHQGGRRPAESVAQIHQGGRRPVDKVASIHQRDGRPEERVIPIHQGGQLGIRSIH